MRSGLNSAFFVFLLVGSLAAHAAVLQWGSFSISRPPGISETLPSTEIQLIELTPPPEPVPVVNSNPDPPEPPPEIVPEPIVEEPLPPEPEPDPIPEPTVAPKPIKKPEIPKPVAKPAPAPKTPRISKPVPTKPAPVFSEARADTSKNRPPRYPDIARRNGWEGRCIVRVRVSSSGRVLSVSIQQSSGYGVLDQAALQTVRGWKFHARKSGGSTVDGTVEVPVNFSLRR